MENQKNKTAAASNAFLQANSQNRATTTFESNNFTNSRWRKEAEKQTARSKKSTAKCAEPYEHRININRATSAYANQLCSDLSVLQLQGRADAQIVCIFRVFFSFYSLYLETAEGYKMRQSWLKTVKTNIIMIIIIIIIIIVLSQKISNEWMSLPWDGALFCWNYRMGKDALDLDGCVSQDTACSVRQVDTRFPAKRFLLPPRPLWPRWHFLLLLVPGRKWTIWRTTGTTLHLLYLARSFLFLCCDAVPSLHFHAASFEGKPRWKPRTSLRREPTLPLSREEPSALICAPGW